MHPKKSKTERRTSANASAVRSTEDSVGADQPLSDAELTGLFAPLEEPFQVLILAVSGGADSLAMMHLIVRWAHLCPNSARTVLVATVDHGLRVESPREAAWVGEQARAAGLVHETLNWTGEKPTTGLQDSARNARYHLLAELAWRFRDRGPVGVVTAHTQDDQAETFLMRLARGSGLDGLTGMSTSRLLDTENGVRLVRPLLGVARSRLVATLHAHGLTWLDDPSNEAERFERVRIRKARSQLEAIGLTNEMIALSARRLERARDALERDVHALQESVSLDVNDGAYASLDAGPLFAAPAEVRLRLFTRLIAAFGGQEQPPRLSKLESLIARLELPDCEATLGGCILARNEAEIRVFREPGRTGLPELALEPGTSAIWDRRFRVWTSEAVGEAVTVRGLGTSAFSQLRKGADSDLPPARAAATLPSFWRKAELLAVPQLAGHLGLENGGARATDGLCSAEFLW